MIFQLFVTFVYVIYKQEVPSFNKEMYEDNRVTSRPPNMFTLSNTLMGTLDENLYDA